MSKIIFVKPLFGYEEGDVSIAGKDMPLGLCYLAGICRQSGYEVGIIDALALKKNCEQAVDLIIKESPEYVGITAVSLAIHSAAAIARGLKERDPGITVIIGGPHVSAVPRETMERFPEFDIGVIGEGEDTLVRVLDHIERGKELVGIPGLVIRRKDGVSITGKPSRIKDLDRLPYPAFDLLPPIHRYYRYALSVSNVQKLPVAPLITSRGCPHQCIFCDRSVFGNYYAAHGAEYVVSLMKELQERYGARSISFEDENFLLSRERSDELLRMLKRERLGLTWGCSTRVDFINDELLCRMKEAGCWRISFGIESGSQEMLDFMKKGITLGQIENAVRMTKRAGIYAVGFFLLGGPGETRETLGQTLGLMRRLELDEMSLCLFTPYPGMEVYDGIERFGAANKKWQCLSRYRVNFVPNGLTDRDIRRAFRKGYAGFYLRPRIIFSYFMRMGNMDFFKDTLARASCLLKAFFKLICSECVKGENI
jgi:radical SAM superfamily enzyme YgiQ (UPF0313 family)